MQPAAGENGVSAYLDIEFGYVYGTCRSVMMPIEIGAVIHRRDDDNTRYAGEQFCYDIDVEIWKKVTDSCGRTVGVATTVANPGRGMYDAAYDHSFRLPADEVPAAKKTAQKAFADLGLFMESALPAKDIPEIVVFAADMERRAFWTADVSLDGRRLIDFQREIRRRLGMRQVLSLDRLARLIEFSVDGSTVASTHFCYPVPTEYRHLLGIHRGMGDAIRMFLLAREFCEQFPDLEGRIRALVRNCREEG